MVAVRSVALHASCLLLLLVHETRSSPPALSPSEEIPKQPETDTSALSPWNSTALPTTAAAELSSNCTSPEDGQPPDNALSVGAFLAALSVAFLGAAMANASGVGGGAVFVPIFNLVLGEDLKHSTAMSQVMVTAGALVGVLLNWHKKNPLDPARALIEVDFVVLLMPAMLLGISIGVLFNVALQVWLQKLLMVTLYVYLSFITLKKGCQLLSKELEARRCNKEVIAANEGYQSTHASEVSLADTVGVNSAEQGCPQADQVATVDGISSLQKSHISHTSLAGLVALWAVYFSFSLMHHTKPFCVRCSVPFWILYAIMTVTTVITTVAILRHLVRKNSPALTEGPEDLHADLLREELVPSFEARSRSVEEQGIDWSQGNLIKCTLVMALAGVMAGFMGIGGGMIMSPLLLTLNVHPQVTAATSSMMVFFSSSAAFVQLALEGMIDPWSAVSFGVLAMAASATGVVLVRTFIQRYGTTSIIVLMLGAFIAIAAVVILVSGIMEFEIVDRSYLKLFYNICGGSLEETAESCLN